MPQVLPYSDQAIFSSQGLKAGAFALIYVAPISAIGNPPFPLSSIYTDQTGTVLQANPFQADQIGNFTFWVPAGEYLISVNFGVSSQFNYVFYIALGTGGGGGPATSETLVLVTGGSSTAVPDPVANDGLIYTYKKTDATGIAAITGTIDGDPSGYALVNQNQYVSIQAQSGAWWVISNN